MTCLPSRFLLTRSLDCTANNRLLYAIMLTDGELKMEYVGTMWFNAAY